MKGIFVKAVSGALAVTLACGFLAGCGGRETFDNETTPLVFSTQPLDGVFNPFFSTSATDGNVVGLTQIGMIGNDKEGNPTYGDDEMVVAKDVGYVTKGIKDVDQTTTYYFVLKNNIRFSNGSYLTMKDVLFNMYVYLDPVYTGSTTMYSTDIVGLKEYRTQEATETEQDAFMDQFRKEAQTRIDNLIAAKNELYDGKEAGAYDADSFLEALIALEGSEEAQVVKDYKRAIQLYSKELESDYTAAMGTYQDTVFTNKAGEPVYNQLQSDNEQFLYNEGYLTWKKDDNAIMPAGEAENWRSRSKADAIKLIYDLYIPSRVDEVVSYWVTADNLYTELTNDALEQEFKGKERTYKSIEGIKFINRTEALNVTVKDYVTNQEKTLSYGVPTYNADGSVKEGNEVLAITINNIDPKAIWNFAFTVAPMYYYSDKAHIEAFDYDAENYGVEWGSQTFMNEVVGSPEKNDVPVGAGPYAASCKAGGIENIKGGDFFDSNIVYYERNPYYIKPALIKKVRYQVSQQTTMLNSLFTKEIDFVEPNAKSEVIDKLNARQKEGFESDQIETAGYGYIGINAGKVPSIYVRRAIMYCIWTQECVDYYGSNAQPIYRSMSLSSWAYPTGAVSYYPYIGGPVPKDTDLGKVDPDYAEFVTEKGYKAGDKLSKEDQQEFIEYLVEDLAGYRKNSEGIYYKGSDTLNYRFTVVGDETDHPAYIALNHARELLNQWGFKVEVKTDHDGLTKLATGALAVWAAAWGSTIDPDMYQVYHKDSTATSVLNWGYRQILRNAGDRYRIEKGIVEKLSDLIDEAREVSEKSERAPIYKDALDKVMELAVELPTYQRSDLFAYNAKKIDSSTFTPEDQRSAFKGLTSDIHLISLIVAK